MNYKTHVTGGALAGICLLHYAGIETSTTIIMASSIVGSLLPDIDHTKSYIGQRVKPVSMVINKTMGHRGITHSPLASLIILSLAYLALRNYTNEVAVLEYMFLGLYTGMISHIFLDLFNSRGIPIFYPLSRKYISFGKVKVGSKIEKGINALLFFAIIISIIAFFA